MTQSQELKSNKDRIRQLMINNPDLRHDDRMLCTMVWEGELPKVKLTLCDIEVPKWEWFRANYEIGNLTEAGVITRLSRFIRNEMGWIKPKKEEQNKVRKIYSKKDFKQDLFH